MTGWIISISSQTHIKALARLRKNLQINCTGRLANTQLEKSNAKNQANHFIQRDNAGDLRICADRLEALARVTISAPTRILTGG